MSVKRTGQFSFVDALASDGAGRNTRLDRLDQLVKWYRFEKLLAPLRSDSTPGRPAYRPLVMFKALLLQRLYNLSDAELEEAVSDRLSFRRFVGLSLEDDVPDHTTLCRFRNLLVAQGLMDKLFAELDRQIDNAGLILRRGTMLDATVIETTAARPNGEAHPSSDPDARFGKRTGKAGSVFGFKAHVAVDDANGIIRRVITTPANTNDTVVADALIMGDERSVMADSAYHTHAREAVLRARGVKCRLMYRANKHGPLRARQLMFNRLVARRRAAVETTFATLKCRMKMTAIRYRGLVKAGAQVVMAAIAFNMRRWASIAA